MSTEAALEKTVEFDAPPPEYPKLPLEAEALPPPYYAKAHSLPSKVCPTCARGFEVNAENSNDEKTPLDSDEEKKADGHKKHRCQKIGGERICACRREEKAEQAE
ncbi:hypothetical protein M3Y99_01783400 [Aphelenchoides fujianensis]|nr:hypothetical protein M3Y99_01783400 [Aphelenchoides fujianensis]